MKNIYHTIHVKSLVSALMSKIHPLMKTHIKVFVVHAEKKPKKTMNGHTGSTPVMIKMAQLSIVVTADLVSTPKLDHMFSKKNSILSI